MILLQPPEFTAENVRDFPVRETLMRFLSSFYDIQVTLMDSVNYGMPVARLRLYMVARHRGKTCVPTRTLASHCESMQRPCNFNWQEVFWMNDAKLASSTSIKNEIDAEWRWGTGRPSSLHQQHLLKMKTMSEEKPGTEMPVLAVHCPDAQCLMKGPCPAPDADENELNNVTNYDFTVALTTQELHNAELYELRWPSMVFSLNQNAEERGYKSTRRYLQTFLHNFGILWTFNENVGKRWLFATEALSAMGFPVHPECIGLGSIPDDQPEASTYLLCSFNAERKGRKPTDVRAQCGNTDSLPLAAVAEMFSLLYFQYFGMNLAFMYVCICLLCDYLLINISNIHCVVAFHTFVLFCGSLI